MFENYLLNATAIAAIANTIDGFRTSPLTADAVQAAIESRMSNNKYFCSRDDFDSPADRLHTVHAADILKDIFADFSEARVAYQKVKHGTEITKWLIQNSPTDLQEVCEVLRKVLSPSNSPAIVR